MFICKSDYLNRLLSTIFYEVWVTIQVMVYQVTTRSHHSDITVIAKESEKSRCSQHETGRVSLWSMDREMHCLRVVQQAAKEDQIENPKHTFPISLTESPRGNGLSRCAHAIGEIYITCFKSCAAFSNLYFAGIMKKTIQLNNVLYGHFLVNLSY